MFSVLVQRLPRRAKQAIMVVADVVMLPLALWSAFALRFGTPTPDVERFWLLFLLVPLATVPVLQLFGMYRAIIRFMSSRAALAVIAGVSVSALLLLAFSMLSDLRGLPRSVAILYWIMALLYVGGSRFLIRLSLQGLGRMRTGKEPVIIYGAGGSGTQAAAALLGGDRYEPVAFVDDDRSLHGGTMHGVPVHGPERLPELVERLSVDQVLLAMPSASRSRRNAIIERLEPLAVHVRTLPALSDLVSGDARVDEVREVEIEDLLGRDPVAPSPELLHACISGKVVMVTGAGGSIGSELCRQILALEPRVLVAFELSELALYRIDNELKALTARHGLQVKLVPLLGSVTERAHILRIMQSWRVQTVYHAAAYKHVPIVENNLLAGVFNNVFGTWNCAEAAASAGVETFVLVSTDKAVRPTNVMGATKRFAELVLQGMNSRPPRRGRTATTFCMVRFGNVLGSSGSVVPLFRDQIARGGPVTVTHQDVTRYFMTIPEAAGLVIQAGAMAQGGDVFVLDMGEPVRIVDLARRMIRLAGLEVRDAEHPHGDIAIEFTGLRPGEKLYEELLLGDDVTPTPHPMILRAQELAYPWPDTRAYLRRLEAAWHGFDCHKARALLTEVVHGYCAADEIHDLMWRQHGGPPAGVLPPRAPAKVTYLAAKRGD